MTPSELKDYRINALGLTQESLAEKLGVTKMLISLMESGKSRITDRTIMQIRCLRD